MNMAGRKIRCRSCGQSDLYQTTEAYQPGVISTPKMFEITLPKRKIGIRDLYNFGHGGPMVKGVYLECLFCEGSLAGMSGQLNVLDEYATGYEPKPEPIPEPIPELEAAPIVSEPPVIVETLIPKPVDARGSWQDRRKGKFGSNREASK